MTGLLEAAAGFIERRTLMSTWLPVLVFAAGTAAIAVTGAGWADAHRWWKGVPTDGRVLATVLAVAATALAARLLAAARPAIIRLYEGHWNGSGAASGPGARLAGRCRARQAALRARGPAGYPLDPDRVMPTRLGNVLRAAEEHPRRYRIDAVTAWPRLYATLPEPFLAAFAAAAAALETAVTVSFLGGAFAVVGGTIAVFCLPWYGVLACVWGGAAVCLLGYRAAVHSAVPYADLVRTAFDVHRWNLLDAMGLSRPTGYLAELKQWEQLHQWWQRGAPDSDGAAFLGYPEAPAPGAPSPEPERESEQEPERRPPPPVAPAPGLSTSQGTPFHTGRFRLNALAVTVLLLGGAAAALAPHAGPDAGDRGPAKALRDLRPYQVVTRADVGRPGRKLVGRYTTARYAKGAKIDPKRLGPVLPAGGLDGRVVTTVPVRDGADGAGPGDLVTLVAGPAGKGGGALTTVPRVLVLNVPGKDRAVIALPEGELRRLLGAADGGYRLFR